jgi:uncharacterized protein YjhX (UPF0386 family)
MHTCVAGGRRISERSHSAVIDVEELLWDGWALIVLCVGLFMLLRNIAIVNAARMAAIRRRHVFVRG